MRVRRTVHQRLAGADAVAFADRQVLALRDQVLARIADLGNDEHLALALGVLAEVHDAVDLADDCVILRLACFEQLGDARQTAGDVLRLRGLARNLGDHVAGLDVVAVVDDRCSSRPAGSSAPRHRSRPPRELDGVAVRVLQRDARARYPRPWTR